MKLTKLKINGISEPLGYRLDQVTFSWKTEDCGQSLPVKFRIQVWKVFDKHNCIYDSGEMEYQSASFFSTSLELEPRTRYSFELLVMDSDQNLYSEISGFETGKRDEIWIAEWISADEESPEEMPVLYKDIDIPFDIKTSRMYVYGLGLYEVFVNQEEVGDELLKPGYHSYDLTMPYQSLNLDNLLVKGNNRVEILLGEGWYKGRFGFDGEYRNIYGDRKKCIAEIYIEGIGGEVLQIVTDDSWKAHTSHVQSNGIYDGEVVDETLENKEQSVIVLKDDKSLLTDRTNPPVKRVEKIPPHNSFFDREGSLIFDFGKILTGWVELTADFEKNQKVELLYGEVLQEECFYNDNLRTAQARFQFTSLGGFRKIRPHFTFFGFRYVKITGLNQRNIHLIHAYAIRSELEESGKIVTSNPKVNQLFENTKQSQKCNFLDIPTDCPQRDERMGWTGDVTVFAQTACYHMDSELFFHNYLENLKLEQKLLQGSVPFFVPTPKLPIHADMNPFYMTSGAAVWGDVATVLPWTLYQMYGNMEYLKSHYPVMRAWVKHLEKVTESNKTPYLWQNERQLGDWLALDNGNIHNPIGLTDQGMIASAYYYQSVQLTANAAECIGDLDALYFRELEAHIRAAFLDEFFSEDGTLKVVETQTACALLLNMNLYPEKSHDYLRDTLKRLLDMNDCKLNTGFVGTVHLLQALSDHGLNEYAYNLLLNEEYPGWLYEVNLGATTIWERWNSILEDGTISGTDMNSLNHYAYGCVAGWMYRTMCGFIPEMSQQVKMIIAPKPDQRIGHVNGSFTGRQGTFLSEWTYMDNCIRYKIVIPDGASARICIGDEVDEVYGDGTHYFNQSIN